MPDDDIRGAAYVRVSTDEQDPARQLDEAKSYITSTYDEATVEEYPDIVTGTTTHTERSEYDRLWDEISDGELDVVVVHEISRLSRLGSAEVQKFIAHCLDNDTAVKDLEVGLEIRVEDSELQQTVYKMVASLMGDLAKIEHQQLMRRIRSGIRRAKREGKWTGRPPKGFTTDDSGYLEVVPAEFIRVQEALEDMDRGDHPQDVADSYGLNRSTLERLFKHEKGLYLDSQARDDRVQEAVDNFDVTGDSDVV